MTADPVRIALVFSNLLSNALKFSHSGDVVTIAAEADDDTVTFSVVDHGAGIPPEQIPHVFERFFRGESDQHQGAGLGLAIAKEIVEAHGGRIWVTSTPGAGSVFSFRLNRAERTSTPPNQT